MRRVLTIIFLILITAFSTLSLYGFFQLRHARRLVKGVADLQIGKPIPNNGQAEFRNLRCISGWGCYKGVSNLPFMDFFASPRKLPPRMTLSKWWGVLGRIVLDSNGNVLEKSLSIDDGQYHQDGTVGISVREDPLLSNPCEHPGVAGHLGYLPHRAMRTGALLVDLAPDANPTFVHRAFDVHLDCLNSFVGCETPGDIAPAAWQDSAFREQDLQEFFKSCRK